MDGYKIVNENKELKAYRDFISACRAKWCHATAHRHHIVPKAMGGGSEEENIIRLSPKDHKRAHQILAYYLTRTTCEDFARKMAYAAEKMRRVN